MNSQAKRAFDLVVVLGTAVIWLPLLGILALAVRYSMGASVLFRQARAGKHGKHFELRKFRTMKHPHQCDPDNQSDSDRVTPFGMWLRSTSLDELPELINVLRGEMSLVGPRPLLVQYLERYTAEQRRRHDVLPGLTGWAQVNGRNALSWEEKFKLDVWYVDNQSLWLDLKILLLTFKTVLKREGINSEKQVGMPEFMGIQGRAGTIHEYPRT